MKYLTFFAFLSILTFNSFSQTNQTSSTPSRPRIVVTSTPTPTPAKVVIVTNNLPSPTPTPVISSTPVIVANPPSTTQVMQPNYNSSGSLTLGQIRSKLAEAKREMSTRPIPTAMTDSFLVTDVVRIAFYDWDTKKIDYIVMLKDSFLKKDGEFMVTSADAKMMKIKIIRPNGVNTPVAITDMSGKMELPLMVQYPVERNGVLNEIAYYMSTHPGLVTPEVVNAGKIYVKNTIDVAREKLREKGIFIAPKVADMAERLSAVEHVDHYRFRTEYHPNIYNDIFTLYALNEGQTYRYSVSSAGAGGMVQMIPSTYFMIRSRYSGVGLMTDFVEGMRNHVNASQAMLLYMQMTYNDLVSNQTVFDAIQTGIATETELMSAGYNSNPAKLPGYIRRGGAGWKNLIPRETQIYLQINASMDKFVPITPRTR